MANGKSSWQFRSTRLVKGYLGWMHTVIKLQRSIDASGGPGPCSCELCVEHVVGLVGPSCEIDSCPIRLPAQRDITV